MDKEMMMMDDKDGIDPVVESKVTTTSSTILFSQEQQGCATCNIVMMEEQQEDQRDEAYPMVIEEGTSLGDGSGIYSEIESRVQELVAHSGKRVESQQLLPWFGDIPEGFEHPLESTLAGIYSSLTSASLFWKDQQEVRLEFVALGGLDHLLTTLSSPLISHNADVASLGLLVLLTLLQKIESGSRKSGVDLVGSTCRAGAIPVIAEILSLHCCHSADVIELGIQLLAQLVPEALGVVLAANVECILAALLSVLQTSAVAQDDATETAVLTLEWFQWLGTVLSKIIFDFPRESLGAGAEEVVLRARYVLTGYSSNDENLVSKSNNGNTSFLALQRKFAMLEERLGVIGQEIKSDVDRGQDSNHEEEPPHFSPNKRLRIALVTP